MTDNTTNMDLTEQEHDGTTEQDGDRTVTVRVWSGGRRASSDDILDDDPDEYEMEVVPEDTYHVPHEDHVLLAENIDHHGTYAFHVDTDEPVRLVVQTNDHHHHPEDEGFERGRPVEGGLVFVPEGHDRYADEPFQCELWGRVRMRVEERES